MFDSILLMLGMAGIFFFITNTGNTGNEKIPNLKRQYDNDLASGNKSKALISGRAYYKAKRGNAELTIYDEQAIANDLAAM